MLKACMRADTAGHVMFELPAELSAKKAVVKVNCESECLTYAVLSVLHYGDVKDYRDRVTKYAAWKMI